MPNYIIDSVNTQEKSLCIRRFRGYPAEFKEEFLPQYGMFKLTAKTKKQAIMRAMSITMAWERMQAAKKLEEATQEEQKKEGGTSVELADNFGGDQQEVRAEYDRDAEQHGEDGR